MNENKGSGKKNNAWQIGLRLRIGAILTALGIRQWNEFDEIKFALMFFLVNMLGIVRSEWMGVMSLSSDVHV